jgi:peroxisomal enoyl-CoA hydratase 2
LHGLSAFGFAARGLISEVGNNDPRSLKFFGTRFTAPVSPGDALETQAWEVGPGPNGTIEVAFITKNITSSKVRDSNYMWYTFSDFFGSFDQVALGGGIAFIKKLEKSRL